MDFSYNNKSKNSGMFQKEYFLKEFLDLINNKLFFLEEIAVLEVGKAFKIKLVLVEIKYSLSVFYKLIVDK